MAIFGGDDLVTGREAQLPEWLSPLVGGAGPQFGDNNTQMPYLAFPTVAPYFDFTGPPGERGVTPYTWGDEGYVPFNQFAGPSGQIGLLPNLAFLYGQQAENLREGTHPGYQPLEAGFNPIINTATQWMADAVPALTPYTGDALQGIRRLLRGETSYPGQGVVDYFSGLPAPIYARGNDPLYTAGLAALGGAGRLFPSMLDPLTEGSRRSALSGTVPVGTYEPLIRDIERRGAERQSDLTQTFEEDVLPGIVQRLATGQANYGSAGERLAARASERYGEQQRRIEDDIAGQVTALHSQAAQDALARQYGAMGLGAQAAQNIFGRGAGILGQQTGLEQTAMGSQLDRALQAAQLGMGTGLDAYRIGLGALPSINQTALAPTQAYMGTGLLHRDIESAVLADRYRRDPLNLAMADLQNYAGLLGLSPMPGPVGVRNAGSSDLAGLGAALSGLGTLFGGFGLGGGIGLGGPF